MTEPKFSSACAHSDKLEELIEKARSVQMSEDEMREQRISFVYGNTRIDNEHVTREMVREAEAKLRSNQMTYNTLNEPRHDAHSHLKLSPSESRIWAQYQLTPNAEDTAKALGYKKNTVDRALYTIREKIDAQKI